MIVEIVVVNIVGWLMVKVFVVVFKMFEIIFEVILWIVIGVSDLVWFVVLCKVMLWLFNVGLWVMFVLVNLSLLNNWFWSRL